VKFNNFFFLILSKEAGHYDTYIDMARTIAIKHYHKLIFITVNTDIDDHKTLLNLIRTNKNDAPTMRLLHIKGQFEIHKPNTKELTVNTIEQFVNGFLKGESKKDLLRQILPINWDKSPVKILVTDNFDEVAFNKEQNVLVQFHIPNCVHCQRLEPIYNELAENYKNSENVIIAKIDNSLNELQHTTVVGYPTLKFYRKGDNYVTEYEGDYTVEALSKFIKKSSGDAVIQSNKDEL